MSLTHINIFPHVLCDFLLWLESLSERILLTPGMKLGSSEKHLCFPLPKNLHFSALQCSPVAQSCPTICDPMNRSTPGLPVQHQLQEFTQTHVHQVGDTIQPSHPLSSPSPPALSLSQHQGLFNWVSSSHEVAKVLEFQLRHQSFQWTPTTDLI